MIDAPSTIDQALDTLIVDRDIVAPNADFLYSNIYQVLTENVTSGAYVGRALVAGVVCDHLAYRSEDLDWQLWIATGDKPLPIKYVITSKQVEGMPEFESRLTWSLGVSPADADFTFVPPDGAKQIRSVAMTDVPAQADQGR